MTARERSSWRVGFFVEVDVAAADGNDAALVAEVACGWPGDWSPPLDPVTCQGEIAGRPVVARIIRTKALMAKEVDR